jgi:hypothetical protein
MAQSEAITAIEEVFKESLRVGVRMYIDTHPGVTRDQTLRYSKDYILDMINKHYVPHSKAAGKIRKNQMVEEIYSEEEFKK